MTATMLPHIDAPGASLTWQDLAALEPRLGDLHARARSTRGLCEVCAFFGRWEDGRYMSGLKADVVRLVGYASEHPDRRLHMRAAYDIAYHRVLRAIPSCPRCRV